MLRRSALAAFQLLLLSAIVFWTTELLPGDAATVRLTEGVSADQLAQTRHSLALDEPPAIRFWHWLTGLLGGDLGTSLAGHEPVSMILAGSFGPTLVLTVATTVVLVPTAMLLGVTAGLRAGSRLDRALSTTSIALHSIPDFALALVLVTLLSLQWNLLPATAVGVDSWGLLARPQLLVLPVLVLLCRVTSMVSRQVRAGTIEVLGSPYLRQARRLGVPRAQLLLRHLVPNAVAPAVQSMARVGDGLLGGVLVVEAVFGIPGVATALIEAVSARDIPVVQGLTVVLGAATLIVNLGADVIAHRLVPRSGQV